MISVPATVTPVAEPFSVAEGSTYTSWPGVGTPRSSVITTLKAGTSAMFWTVTVYSSVAPGSAAPPPTTATCFVISSCWSAPTTTVWASS